MKKILAVALTLMLIPFSAFGLEMLEDSTLDNVTGQAGVSIATDVIMDVHFDTVAWGDSDGVDVPYLNAKYDASLDADGDGVDDNNNSQYLGTGTTAGWVGITDLDITNLRIKIRDDLAGAGFVTEAAGGDYDWTAIQLFTIDVATDSDGTYVHMLLGTQQVTFDTMDGVVELGADTGLGDVLGEFYIGGFELLMAADSYVDIRAHGGSGVTIDFGVLIDSITMDAMSWGDADGLGTDPIDGMFYNVDTVADEFTAAGYVGLSNAAITGLAASGSLLIDVASMNESAILGATTFVDPTSGLTLPESYLLYVYVSMLNDAYDGSSTAVLLQFSDLTASMATFTADVVLAADNGLTTAASTLGSVYAAGMDVTMNGWVGIFAH